MVLRQKTKQLFIEYLLYSYREYLYVKHNTLLEAFYSVDKQCIHICLLVTDTKNRRKGYGTRALTYVKNVAKVFSVPVVLMPEVVDDVALVDVIKFYCKNGFTAFGEDGYYRWVGRSKVLL